VAEGVETFAALYFLVIGLSHVVQPRAWVELFRMLQGYGRAGAFMEGFLSLALGAFIVAFHNVWSGPEIVLTLIGWAQVAKGALRFVAPQLGLRAYEKVSLERAWQFQVGGVLSIAIGIFLAFLIVRSGR
jgi:uncharacterized protein YjeT (DUF2065 family)